MTPTSKCLGLLRFVHTIESSDARMTCKEAIFKSMPSGSMRVEAVELRRINAHED